MLAVAHDANLCYNRHQASVLLQYIVEQTDCSLLEIGRFPDRRVILFAGRGRTRPFLCPSS